ncbi:MAG: HK97 family phage prohead protease [Mesorhizobium sp.]|nr:MAG: HK97 family phage prohead protease [Mesorhizobium sp.]
MSGYAARFGSITQIGDSFRERLAPGCFKRTLRDLPDVVMILDHDSGRVLGRVSAGTLQIHEDSTGLHFTLEADPTTPEGMTAIGSVARQDVRGCSFGFRVRAESWQDDGDNLPLRTIEDVDLYEVTLTAFPQYETTSASLSGRSGSVRRVEADLHKRGIETAPAHVDTVTSGDKFAAYRDRALRQAQAAMRLRGIH